MIDEDKHDVRAIAMGGKVTVETFRYPDGSPRNHLTPEELREVADMLHDVADTMVEEQ